MTSQKRNKETISATIMGSFCNDVKIEMLLLKMNQ